MRDGREILIRALRPEDKDMLGEHFARLSPLSRYLRFFGARNSLTAQELASLTDLDFGARAGLVAIEQSAGSERIVAVAHYICAGKPSCAEFACDVADEYQGRGLATILLEHLARIARSNGITEFQADVLGSNWQMLKVFADSGFDVRQSFHSGVARITLATSESEKHLRARQKRSRD